MAVRFDFSGKKILVTGASQGIGRELALALAEAGAQVVAVARNANALQQLAEQNSSITSLVGDVSNWGELKPRLRSILPVDGVVNNAGVASLEGVGDIKEETIDWLLSVNLKAPLLISQLAAEYMIDHGINGSIVNISSQASLKPLKQHTVYCSSKAGLDMATRCLAKELGGKGIRVNSVNPTVVLTEMGKKAWSDEKKAATLLDNMAIKRFAECSEVVQSVMVLLSDVLPLTTGISLPVDGGFTTT